MPSLTGVVGTAFMMVFISISSAIVAPMQCEIHPNGYRTVQAYPQAICWSTDCGNGDTDRHMVILGAIANVVPISSSSQFKWDGATQRSYTPSPFCFFRCNPRAYWYVLVMLGRSLAVADEALQLLCFTLVLGPCLVVCGGVFPWRNYMSNIVDITINAGFLLMLLLAALLVEGADKALIADMLTAIFFFVVQSLGPGDLELSSQDDAAQGQYVSTFFCHHKQGG